MDSLLLNPTVERLVDNLVKQLEDPNDVTKTLQRSGTTWTAQAYLNTLLDK